MRYGRMMLTLVSVGTVLAACDDDGTGPGGDLSEEPIGVFEVSGDLNAALTEFRALLGEPVNAGGSGPQPGGRREVRWDGVPADRTNTDAFPADFFRGVGLISTTDGSGLRVSDNDFADIDPSYAGEFESFSKAKTFMSIGSTHMTLTFRLAGTDAPALVSGVGIVFSDVDQKGSTTMTLYGAAGENLGTYTAPARVDAAGFSFIGVAFADARVARAEVVAGDAALAGGRNDLTQGGASDLVVTDDFLFGEPKAATAE